VERLTTAPRPGWRETVERQGLTWHTTEDGRVYWDESAYWRFSSGEVDRIEAATETLYAMCLQAIETVVEGGELAAFGYAPAVIALIEASWRNRTFEPTFYARFDLAYDGCDLKLLELNGDTPTSLVEASVIQWWWLEDRFPGADQFNSIHDKLVEALVLYRRTAPDATRLHLTSVAPHLEDEGTVEYLAACAADAGLDASIVALSDIGWREGDGLGHFVDQDDAPIAALFKLVPWEWLLDDRFGVHLTEEVMAGRLRLIEPAWKMVASNKHLLVTLARMFPGHELLLAATTAASEAAAYGDYVKKPVRGREGANVSIVHAGATVAANDGAYADDVFVYQRRAELAVADGNYAVIGSWVVNRQAAGMGVRESASPITNNLARFVPHIIDG
jgi:glutathionylspermidine synthase